MDLFEFSIKGSTDADGDGNPDVTVGAKFAGFTVLNETFNINLEQGLALFFQLTNTAKEAVGLGRSK